MEKHTWWDAPIHPRKDTSPPPTRRYSVSIPEEFEHSELHLRLKKLVARDGGFVVVDRPGVRKSRLPGHFLKED